MSRNPCITCMLRDLRGDPVSSFETILYVEPQAESRRCRITRIGVTIGLRPFAQVGVMVVLGTLRWSWPSLFCLAPVACWSSFCLRFSAVLGQSRLILLHARGIGLQDCQLARQCLHDCEEQVNTSVHLLLPSERDCAVVHISSVLPIKPRHHAHTHTRTHAHTHNEHTHISTHYCVA